ncbi:MAG: hypothetical protein ACP5QO_09575, partial [Clostridia bacterium]
PATACSAHPVKWTALPTSGRRVHHVPPQGATWSAVWGFASSFDAYALCGGFTPVAQSGHATHDAWPHTGALPEDLDTLRGALF